MKTTHKGFVIGMSGIYLALLGIAIGMQRWVGLGMKELPLPSPSLAPPRPSPTPYVFSNYTLPTIPKKSYYTIFLVGDSMTEALGPHPYHLSQKMNAAYPTDSFIIDNYSVGSKNVESLMEMLTLPMTWDDLTEPGVFDREFDILVIESFGQNPLSTYEFVEGKQVADEALTEVMTRITRDFPEVVVIFLATLGPHKTTFADGLLNLPRDLKAGYVKERELYIENHMAYALSHNIPLLDLYHKSQGADGLVKLEYIRADDNLHPSQVGVEWIQEELAKFIIENHFLPSN